MVNQELRRMARQDVVKCSSASGKGSSRKLSGRTNPFRRKTKGGNLLTSTLPQMAYGLLAGRIGKRARSSECLRLAAFSR